MLSLRSFCALVWSGALLSSCGLHTAPSPISASAEKEVVSSQPPEKQKTDPAESQDFSSEGAAKAPRPQVVQIPSKS